MAGPIYGLGAALASVGLWARTGHAIFVAIAGLGAWTNLFNLLPFGSLDGGCGFHAMSRVQKLVVVAVVVVVVAAAWCFIHPDGILLLIGLLGLSGVLADRSQTAGRWRATVTYAALICR